MTFRYNIAFPLWVLIILVVENKVHYITVCITVCLPYSKFSILIHKQTQNEVCVSSKHERGTDETGDQRQKL